MFRKEAPTWIFLRFFLFWSTWFLCGNAGSLRIPVKGELVYDTMSKTADVCLSPHMCPPWVLGLLCGIVNNPTATITEHQQSSKASKSPSFTYSSPTSSSSTTPTTTPSSSSTKGTSSTTVTTETSNSKPTEGPTSRSSTPSSSSTTITEKTTTGATEEATVGFLEAGLDEHNKYRKIHESAPLIISPTLNRDAKAAAERIAAQGSLIHTEDNELNGQGENIGKMCDSHLTPEEMIGRVVGRWYKEVCNYDFSNPSLSDSTGHFTQLVWASTKQLGLGWEMGKDDNCHYVVGRYFPEGNIETRLEENVKKGSFDGSYCNLKKSGVQSRQFSNWLRRLVF